jgi:murein DD-endopeptidase MepM/ murein hydrolase activator NlpD
MLVTMKTNTNTHFYRLYKMIRRTIPVVATAIFIVQQILVPVRAATEYTLNNAVDKEIWQLNQQIDEKRKAAAELQRQVDVYKKTLAEKQKKISTLNGQIGEITASIAKISLEADALDLQVQEVNLRLQSTDLKIAAKQTEIDKQKDNMAEIIRLLDSHYQGNNLLAILATNKNLGDYMDAQQTFQLLQDNLYSDLKQMNNLKVALVADQQDLQDHQETLSELQDQLEGKRDQLESQKYSKDSLIKTTKGEESRYQALLQSAKAEAAQISSDITNLETVAREKLNRNIKQNGSLGDDEAFGWPVPSHVINANFHDPDYPFRKVFEHPGVDIKAKQGTEVRAAMSGYVGKAKNAGMGYSYVLLVHDNDLSTVYGHLSKIIVADDTFVTKGQIIGYSGGTPGTPGAGPFVTGPHLHFEVRLKGIPVDPLNYLP